MFCVSPARLLVVAGTCCDPTIHNTAYAALQPGPGIQHAACSMHHAGGVASDKQDMATKPPDKRSEANVRINISQAVPQTLEPSGGLILGIVTLLNIAELVLGG